MTSFIIAHLYPNLMNLYGDRGNLICLQKRLEWLGYDCRVKSLDIGDEWNFADVDMIFMGGGSDREQSLVYDDLQCKKEELWREIKNGFPVLFICGSYQLLGSYYLTGQGFKMEGLNYFDFFSEGGPKRLIGNIVVEVKNNNETYQVIGFENHGGYTYFNDTTLRPWGKVIKGHGNNGKDHTEGIIFNNLIGTYLHGPLLPKNPAVADFFIRVMMARKGINIDSGCLTDKIENYARQQVLAKVMKIKS
ncbi:MAG: glutamine amidotransferase [Syntrophomonadaceae bacterium]|jgi:CobQ-like glutamine amidotransferase family enzyme|nr:glutamine amidotransferase [Syntrophomonadaceae bacterium]